MDADETPSASESGVRSSGRGFHAGGNSAVGAAGGGAAAGCGGGGGEMVSSFAVDLRLSCALGGGICMLQGRSTNRGVWPSVCEGWWALGRPQCRPELHDTNAPLQKWMFDGPVRTSEWV